MSTFAPYRRGHNINISKLIYCIKRMLLVERKNIYVSRLAIMPTKRSLMKEREKKRKAKKALFTVSRQLVYRSVIYKNNYIFSTDDENFLHAHTRSRKMEIFILFHSHPAAPPCSFSTAEKAGRLALLLFSVSCISRLSAKPRSSKNIRVYNIPIPSFSKNSTLSSLCLYIRK